MKHDGRDLFSDPDTNAEMCMTGIFPMIVNPGADRLGIVTDWNARTLEIHGVYEVPMVLSTN